MILLHTLIFSIVNRTHYDITTHLLFTHNPQDCVPTLETNLYRKTPITNLIFFHHLASSQPIFRTPPWQNQ
uniref:Uncharacterized protein n=1 Tax=Nelumbo nucifera TaxID=4432 RepID=A0A822ZTB0_NELNU|nr:TPA_asm: hypothetical protein HUJ06_018100 [Nelumbo nucifera]